MKKLIFLLIMLGLAFTACQKDAVHGPFVGIAGNFLTTPDLSAGMLQVPRPGGSYYESPKMYTMDGTCDYFDNIDNNQSIMEVSSMAYVPSYGGYEGEVLITVCAENGDKLYLKGQMSIYTDNSMKGFFHFNGGTGKFENSEGWMNFNGQSDPSTRQNTLMAAGEICEPN